MISHPQHTPSTNPAWLTDESCTLRDTIRHEYGHAIAFHFPGLVRRSSEFRRVFGTNYGGKYPEEGLDPRDFMTAYAMENPAEDFAETVMVLLRGRMATNISSVAKHTRLREVGVPKHCGQGKEGCVRS